MAFTFSDSLIAVTGAVGFIFLGELAGTRLPFLRRIFLPGSVLGGVLALGLGPQGLAKAFLAVGVLLLLIGIYVWQWPDSVVSGALAGAPTNQAPWLLLGGVVFVVLGLLGLFRNVPTKTAHDVIPQETMKKQTEHNKQKEELE